MLIAVAAAGAAAQPIVPESFEESLRLYIVETDEESVTAVYDDPGDHGLLFAERTAAHGCEAVACGRFRTAPAFDVLADACITRYYAAGLPVLEAALVAERSQLPLLTDYEGGKGCGRHEGDRCAEDRAKHES